MQEKLKDDIYFLKIAVKLARKSIIPKGKVYPKVGAVVLDKYEKIIAKTFKKGKLHAEFHALHKLPNNYLQGGAIYTTLEPCTHRNNEKDLSCSEHIIRTGVSKVVIGMLDPNPKKQTKDKNRNLIFVRDIRNILKYLVYGG